MTKTLPPTIIIRKGDANAANNAKSSIFLIQTLAGFVGVGIGAFFETIVLLVLNKLKIATIHSKGIINQNKIIHPDGLKTIA